MKHSKQTLVFIAFVLCFILFGLSKSVEPDKIIQENMPFGQNTLELQKIYPQDFFEWPLKGIIDLTGNFGELRTNHFHSGLDLRTNAGQEGVPVYASGDGYISRINVSSKGYGKAIYITHPNGFTTVYGHLKLFNFPIKNYTEEVQYQTKAAELEVYPDAKKLEIKKGDLIAWSGNTGGSAGPHLHFEIRNTLTSDAINPLLFGLKLNDHIKPEIKDLTIYRLDHSNHLNTGTYRQISYTRKGKTLSKPKMNLAPGVYAFGANWVDYLHDGGFRMGIPFAKLYINNDLYFEQKIESLPFNDWRMVNCHLDHPILEEKDQRIIKLFVDDGNTLLFYPNTKNRGQLMIEDGKNYKIKLVISDFPGHKDSLTFDVYGDRRADENFPPEPQLTENLNASIEKLFFPKSKNVIELKTPEGKLKIEIPEGVLYDTILFKVGPASKTIFGKQIWNIMNSSIPINDSFTIAFKPFISVHQPEKWLMVRFTKSGIKKPEGGIWRNGEWIGKAKMLGQFYWDIDTTGPELSEIFIQGNKFSLKVKDNLSGIKEISVLIDNQWTLYEYEPKSNIVFGEIRDSANGEKREMKVRISDGRGNLSENSKTFFH